MGGLSVHLYIFNRNTRQSIHDIAVKTLVIQNINGRQYTPGIWKGHVIVAILWPLIIVSFAIIGVPYLSKIENFPEMLSLQQDLMKHPNIHVASVMSGNTYGSEHSTSWMAVTIVVTDTQMMKKEAADQVALSTFSHFPNVTSRDLLKVTITYGYDIGISRSWKNNHYAYPPAEWATNLGLVSPEIKEIPPPSERVVQGNRPALSVEQIEKLGKLFLSSDFDQLHQELFSLQKAFEQDLALEWQSKQAYEIFEISRDNYQELLDEWIEKYPVHFSAYLARAHYYSVLASESRGTAYAKETSEEEFSWMRKYNTLALQDVEKALSINNRLLPAYLLQLKIYNTQGNDEEVQKTFNKATGYFPYSHHLYDYMVWFSTPRWGGSYERMRELARQAYKWRGKNPELYWLSGMIYCDMAWYARRDNDFPKAIELYNKALLYGDNSYFYQERGRTYAMQGEINKAITDLNKCVELDPTRKRSYKHRASVLIKAEEKDKAVADIIMLGRLSPGDPDINGLQRWALSYLVNKKDSTSEKYINEIIVASDPESPLREPESKRKKVHKITFEDNASIKNYLKNGDAEEGVKDWRRNGNATVSETDSGNRYFSISNGATFYQTIFVKPEKKCYALLIGMMKNERNDDFAGLPFLWGSITNIHENGKKKMDWLTGQKMRYSAKAQKGWGVGYGIFPVDPSAVSILFKLGQTELKDTPQNGSAANFDDVGLYFFETRQEATKFAINYRSLGEVPNKIETNIQYKPSQKFVGSMMSQSSGGAAYYPKAQSFITPSNYIGKISLYMKEDCSAPWRVYLLSDLPNNGGKRGQVDQYDLDSKTLGYSQVQDSRAGWVDFTFNPPINVGKGKELYLFVNSSALSAWGSSAPWGASIPGQQPGPYDDGEGWVFVYNWNNNSNYNNDHAKHIDYAFKVYE